MKTEAEARKTVCHKTLAMSLPDPRPCIASECMAWRFEDRPMGSDILSELEGYCGLAGKP